MCAWVSQIARSAQPRVFSSARNIAGSSPGSIITASRVTESASSQQFSTNCPLGSWTTSSSDTDGRGRAALQLGEILLDRNGGGGSIAHRRGDLPSQLNPEIAGREQPGNRRHHPVVGQHIARRIV